MRSQRSLGQSPMRCPSRSVQSKPATTSLLTGRERHLAALTQIGAAMKRAPHQWIQPACGPRKPQSPTEESSATPPDAIGTTTRVQLINGAFVCCGHGVDPRALLTLNRVATEQVAPTADAMSGPNC